MYFFKSIQGHRFHPSCFLLVLCIAFSQNWGMLGWGVVIWGLVYYLSVCHCPNLLWVAVKQVCNRIPVSLSGLQEKCKKRFTYFIFHFYFCANMFRWIKCRSRLPASTDWTQNPFLLLQHGWNGHWKHLESWNDHGRSLWKVGACNTKGCLHYCYL